MNNVENKQLFQAADGIYQEFNAVSPNVADYQLGTLKAELDNAIHAFVAGRAFMIYRGEDNYYSVIVKIQTRA